MHSNKSVNKTTTTQIMSSEWLILLTFTSFLQLVVNDSISEFTKILIYESFESTFNITMQKMSV
jgi:hypothetical protein